MAAPGTQPGPTADSGIIEADRLSSRIPAVTHLRLPVAAPAATTALSILRPMTGARRLERRSKLVKLLVPLCLLAAATPASAQLSLGSGSGRYSFGGGVSVGAGDVSFISVSPYLAYKVTEEIDVGVGLFYRLRHDTRFGRDLDTQDAGGSVFGRYQLPGPFFVHAEMEYLNYEAYRGDLSKYRKGATSLLAGGGFSQSIGRNTSAHLMVLYNFSYSGYASPAPYSSPWVLRAGVGIRF